LQLTKRLVDSAAEVNFGGELKHLLRQRLVVYVLVERRDVRGRDGHVFFVLFLHRASLERASSGDRD